MHASLDAGTIILESGSNLFSCTQAINEHPKFKKLHFKAEKSGSEKEEVMYCYSDGRYVSVVGSQLYLKDENSNTVDSM